VRPFSEIRIASRHFAHAEQLAATDARACAVETPEEAVRGADVVCLCTSAGEPVVSLDWLAPGTHVTSVGYAPPGGELDPRVLSSARLFVETRLAFEPPPVGCAELAGIDPSVGTELGLVLLGRDMAAASLVYHRAKQDGAGRTVVL
jgi:ornithine cyclodeaminase/alanine dehydrogenase-like protein (mu-crystallin family)